VSERLLFNTIWTIFQAYRGENKLRSVRWWWCLLCTAPSSLVGFFIVLYHWNNSLQTDISLRHIILILSQPVSVLSPLCCVLSWETTSTNFIVFCLTLLELDPWFNTFETSMLTITPPMLSKKQQLINHFKMKSNTMYNNKNCVCHRYTMYNISDQHTRYLYRG
jgi:hypothetical protein